MVWIHIATQVENDETGNNASYEELAAEYRYQLETLAKHGGLIAGGAPYRFTRFEVTAVRSDQSEEATKRAAAEKHAAIHAMLSEQEEAG